MILWSAFRIGKRVSLLGVLAVSVWLLTGTPANGQEATVPATTTAITLDVVVMLEKTHQNVPGLKASNFRVYEEGVEQKIIHFEGMGSNYKLVCDSTNSRPGGTNSKLSVELVDNKGSPLRMLDEGHRPLKYDIQLAVTTSAPQHAPPEYNSNAPLNAKDKDGMTASMGTAAVGTVDRAPSANTKLPLKAVLVLSPQFCAWRQIYSPRDVGKLLCKELEPALAVAFSSLTSASETPSTGDPTELVLLPRVTSAASEGMSVPSTVQLEWTVKDKSGRIVLIQTVGGESERRRMNFDKKMEEAVIDVAEQTAKRMASAPELIQFSQSPLAVSEAPSPRTGETSPEVAIRNPNRYTLEYVHSEKKWDHAFRKTDYDEISKYFQDQNGSRNEA